MIEEGPRRCRSEGIFILGIERYRALSDHRYAIHVRGPSLVDTMPMHGEVLIRHHILHLDNDYVIDADVYRRSGHHVVNGNNWLLSWAIKRWCHSKFVLASSRLDVEFTRSGAGVCWNEGMVMDEVWKSALYLFLC